MSVKETHHSDNRNPDTPPEDQHTRKQGYASASADLVSPLFMRFVCLHALGYDGSPSTFDA